LENDQEPERYYDWMLWKMRQEVGIVNSYPDGYSTDWRQYEMKFKFKEEVVKSDLNKEKELFCITAEECGELVQACMKIARWGVDKKKLQDLIEEAGDVALMIDLIVDAGYITKDEIKARKQVKKLKLKKYSSLHGYKYEG
tara:strand:- start:1279 stop:1701 length:423 start_codon:yes stop_codon:yes gene_type:complete